MLRKYAPMPYMIWLMLFVVIPLLLVIGFGVTTRTPDGYLSINFENFYKFLDPLYLKVFWRSVKLALLSTMICLLLGYPAAYFLSTISKRYQLILVMLFMLPMWMNFLLRTYAWLNILGINGPLNQLLQHFGFNKVQFLFNDYTVLMGMVYNFLPFMVLPIYTVISKIDKSYMEAANDLGANGRKMFLKIILPLSIPGVISGISMVLMPAASTFVISQILGGGKVDLIGNIIERQFMNVRDWHFGSTVSIVLMVVILISMLVMNKYSDKMYNNNGGMEL